MGGAARNGQSGGGVQIQGGAEVSWSGGGASDHYVEAVEFLGAAVRVTDSALTGTGLSWVLSECRVDQAAVGGALAAFNSTVELRKVVATLNVSDGPMAGGTLFTDAGERVLENAYVGHNYTSGQDVLGTGVAVLSGTATVRNTDFIGNQADGSLACAFDVCALSGSLTVTHSNAWKNLSNGVEQPRGADGMLQVDPGYLDLQTLDLTLTEASELIDAGDPDLKDVDGSVSDIGAYGGPNSPW